MEIRAIHLGLIKTNCYLISTDKAAVVIDPGFKTEITADFLKANIKRRNGCGNRYRRA